ncbi:MAG: exodeoxyribonuclease III [Chloroflexi bacterium]|nr:exodeoxyribonuclease III [Chloroflexota bacterium]OJV89427.1 MAG: exodeoxyribonuclease III [Chloroflexi bacterium 54-19]
MTLKIATWNVNSIAARLPIATQWLESLTPETRPDVIGMQEIKCVDEKFPASEFEKLGYKSVIFGQPTYNGLATLVRDELAGSLEVLQKNLPDDQEDAQRRLLAVKVAGVTVINVYVPNGQSVGSAKYDYKLDWLARLRQYLDNMFVPTEKLTIIGDFNVAPEPIDVYDPKVWEGKILFSEPERQAINVLQSWGLNDSYRKLNPALQEFSWWDYRAAGFRRNLGLRIDLIMATDPLLATCQAVTIDKEPRTWERPSDHTPVIAAFDIG